MLSEIPISSGPRGDYRPCDPRSSHCDLFIRRCDWLESKQLVANCCQDMQGKPWRGWIYINWHILRSAVWVALWSFYMRNKGCCSLRRKNIGEWDQTSKGLFYGKQSDLVHLQGLELRLLGRITREYKFFLNIKKIFLFVAKKANPLWKICSE